MTDSNRTRIAYIRESTLGTTPGSPQTRLARITGESLSFNVANSISDELRSDRMVPDLVQTGAQNSGDLNFELSYPIAYTFCDEFIAAALLGAWVNTNERTNFESTTQLSGLVGATGVLTVTTGTAFAANDVCLLSGFANTVNNGVFVATGGSATTAVFGAGAGMTNETPGVGARIKRVGVQGASGDIVAAVSPNRLTSTTLNFTTLGLQVGQWIKIGGAAVATQYNTTALNTWVRVTSIAANALGLDNVPSGWAGDSGTSKTIQLIYGDVIENGTTLQSFTIEKGFLAQTTPNYAVYRGMCPSNLSLNIAANAILTGGLSFLGTTSAISTTALTANPTAASLENVFNAVANVGRIAEGGTLVTGPNFIRNVQVTLNNNLREQPAVGVLGLSGVGTGRCEISGTLEAYFGDATLYTKYVNGTETSLNIRLTTTSPTGVTGSRCVVITFPRIKYESGTIVASGANQDVVAQLGFRAIRDANTVSQIQIDRFDYVP